MQTVTSSVLLLFSILPAECETYKWVDDKGVMNFSDDPSSVPRKYRKQIAAPADSHQPVREPSAARSTEKISKGIQANSKGVQVNERHDYYEIHGSSEHELRQKMNTGGVVGSDGRTYDGYTNWYVKWNFTYQTTRTNCSIATATANVDVIYQLPKWVDRSTAPEALKHKWDRFIRNLELHEYGHRDFGIQAARDIVRAIGSIEPRASCKELGEAANSLGYLILEKSKQEEVEYDRRTRHGLTQEVKFP